MSYGAEETAVTSSKDATSLPKESIRRASLSPITRSATFTDLSAEAEPQAFPARTDSIRRSFSENVLPLAKLDNVTSPSTPARKTAASASLPKPVEGRENYSTRRKSTNRAVTPQFSVGAEPNGVNSGDESTLQERNQKHTDRPTARASVTESFTKLARRSWITSSRSPSPAPNKRRSRGDLQRSTEEDRTNSRAEDRSPSKNGEEKAPSTGGEGLTRRPSLLGRVSSGQFPSLKRRKSLVETPTVPPLPDPYSTDKLPSLKHKASNLSDAPAVPNSASYDRLRNLKAELPRKRDELWSVFRTMDGEYSKFQSRPSTTKTMVIRSALIPFLRTYAEHPSNNNLRPEDIDRRTVILNKWWTGLLEMLNGRYGESVSGNDRPAVLEAASAIMVRPEWTSMLRTSARTGKGLRGPIKSRSTTSLRSNMSEFLVDSVFHNVKNTYTQNLLAQMHYVVAKMSTRNIPASVVAFCGKATAYAFFYCDGVASILVRLWNISAEALRRVTAEYGFSRNENLGMTPEKNCNSFPSCLHSMAFKSVASMMRYLRSEPHSPISVASIPWHGPWVSRWAGRDTDLFFIFTKHISELISRCLPDTLPPEEQISAPGWILVQAQLLKVIQMNIQNPRGQNPTMGLANPPHASPDEIRGEADTAAVLPLPSTGPLRSMAENRVIMLLRDCLSNTDVMSTNTQKMFAGTFHRLLKAAAGGISLFDHNACFTLCDFLEEAIAILTRYHKAIQDQDLAFDWAYWFDVCRKMLKSENTMTEIRIYAFLYNMWGTITESNERRRKICEDWLLSQDAFQTQFAHWCPMVRAHYMRLLMWKLGRPGYASADQDQFILQTLWNRLEESWTVYLQLQKQAHDKILLRPSTTPCSPAPGRQLLILRDDVQAAPSGMFLSFDGILSSSNMLKSNPYEQHSSRRNADGLAPSPNVERTNGISPVSKNKKGWGLLKSLVPFTTSNDRSPDSSPQTESRKNPAPSAGPTVPKLSNSIANSSGDAGVSSTMPSQLMYRSLSFKFSLEWTNQPTQASGSEPRLRQPVLPPLAATVFQPPTKGVSQDDAFLSRASLSASSRYVGRALAEWNLLTVECENFFERRQAEGVPSPRLVETPTLSVDSFRRI